MRRSFIRIICLLLLGVILVWSAVACGGDATDLTAQSSESTEITSEATENTSESASEESTSTETTAESSETDNTPEADDIPEHIIDEEKNGLAMEEFGKVIRNEKTMCYVPHNAPDFKNHYLNEIVGTDNTPSGQMRVDMDRDGVEELILVYQSRLMLLHFENECVFGHIFSNNTSETIYTDGSFAWSSDTELFGIEFGISRLSFDGGKVKYEELCRTEGFYKFYINGEQVSETKFNEFIDQNKKTNIAIAPFDTSFLDPNESKAIELACAHWNIKDGDIDATTGERYRVVCDGIDLSARYKVYLYCFVNNSYYECIEEALVNVHTGEILTVDPNGK